MLRKCQTTFWASPALPHLESSIYPILRHLLKKNPNNFLHSIDLKDLTRIERESKIVGIRHWLMMDWWSSGLKSLKYESSELHILEMWTNRSYLCCLVFVNCYNAAVYASTDLPVCHFALLFENSKLPHVLVQKQFCLSVTLNPKFLSNPSYLGYIFITSVGNAGCLVKFVCHKLLG